MINPEVLLGERECRGRGTNEAGMGNREGHMMAVGHTETIMGVMRQPGVLEGIRENKAPRGVDEKAGHE